MVDRLNRLHPLYPGRPVKRRRQPPREGHRNDPGSSDHQDSERHDNETDSSDHNGGQQPEPPRTDDDQSGGGKGGQIDEYAAPPSSIYDDSSVTGIEITSAWPDSGSLAAHCLIEGMAGSGRPMKNP